MILDAGGNPFSCEFAARHIDAVARYIIGTAAALSNDFEYAEDLLLDAHTKLARHAGNRDGTPVSALLGLGERAPGGSLLSVEFRLSRKCRVDSNQEILDKSEEVIEKLRQYRPNDYGRHIGAAWLAFWRNRDIATAREELSACTK